MKLDGYPVDIAQIKNACSAIAHRGPDGAAYAVMDHQLGLGSVRLSINDHSGGKQPIYNEDYSIALICNGEIYDYVELRRELEAAGHVFRSGSDSELLVHLYEQYGIDFIPRLNGEFAFILWDKKRRRLLAVRDRSGVKPLYYYTSVTQIVICSEIKGLFAINEVPRKFLCEYFTGPGMGVVSGNSIPFDEVRCLCPGHYFTIENDKVSEEKSYYCISFAPQDNMRLDETVEYVREAIDKAVRRRLIADVPVHCYLSGGIDSTIIFGLMANRLSQFKAYHVSFADPSYSELNLASRTARHFGQELEIVHCTNEMMFDNLIKAVEHVELPLSNCNSIAKMLLSELVHYQGHKVCLTGEGADEVFGGYAYFKLEALWRYHLERKISGRQFRALWAQFQKTESRSTGLNWHKSQAWKRGNTHCYGFPNYLHIRAIENGAIAPWLFNRPTPGNTTERHFLKAYPPEYLQDFHPFNISRWISFGMLAGGIIPFLGDRVEMANSVECRTPYLDPNVLQLAFRIPPKLFFDISHFKEKYVLHMAFKNLIPAFLHNVHKHPFIAPKWRLILDSKRGKELLREYTSRTRIRDAGIYNRWAIATIIKIWANSPPGSHIVRRLDPLIGIILTTHILHDRFIRKCVKRNSEFPMENRTVSRAI